MGALIVAALAWAARYERRLTAILVGLVWAAGALYAVALGDELRFLPDERDYAVLAATLAAGGPYRLEAEVHGMFDAPALAYRPPGYAAALAPVAWLAGEDQVVALRLFNFFTFGLTLWLLAALLRRLAPPPAGLLGALLAAAYGVLFFTAGALYPQTLAGLLFLAALYWLGAPRLTWKEALLGGLAGGWLALTVPTFLPLLGLLLLWRAWPRRRSWEGLRPVLLAGLVMAALVGAWTLRNGFVFDEVVFISTNFGDNLLRGNAPNTTPNSGPATDVMAYMALAQEMDEVGRDRFLQAEVRRLWQADPAWALGLYLGKLANYFNFRNQLYTQSESSPLRDLVMLVTYYPLLLLAGLRLWLARRQPLSALERLAVGLYLFNAFYSAIAFTRIRYRLPADYLVIVLAATCVSIGLRACTVRLKPPPKES